MTSARPRILCIAHEVTLTGSPMNLLHLQRWLREHTDAEVHTLALAPGALEGRFREMGHFHRIDANPVAAALGTAQAGLRALGSRNAWRPINAARLRPQLRSLRHFDLIYCNSLPSVSVLPYLPPARAVVAHAHELEVAWRSWRDEPDRATFRTAPDRWLAASGAVRRMLVDEIGLPADRVLLHYEFIDAQAIAARAISLREVESRRRELGIPASASVVVGAGTVDWRKGPDLFIQLACEVRRRQREPVAFVWVGGDLVGTDWERVRVAQQRAGADHVHFVGVKPDPLPWFALGDVFALTSREDPFPLVALECAAMGTPIVTYRNGGMPELLEAAGPEAATGIVDYLDVGAMADRVVALLDSPRLAGRSGEQLRSRVLAEHDVSVAARRLWGDLAALIEARGGGPLDRVPPDQER